MATETTNYHFSKPAETDYYDVNVQNNNWDVADQALKELDDEKVDKNGGDIANTEVSEFAASSTEWPVPAAGEAPKTLWGKTKKFFEDFKNWMTGVCLLGQLVSNNTTNNANLPASAAAVYQEAQLRANQIAQLNSDLAIYEIQVTNNNYGYGYIDDDTIISKGLLVASCLHAGVYITGCTVNSEGRGTVWFSVNDTNTYTVRYVCIPPS